MSAFTFNRGTWEDGSPLPAWLEDESSDAYLKRIGYTSERTVFGHEDGAHLEIFEHNDDSSYCAHVVPSGGQIHEVYLPDFPSFMMFIRDHGTPFAAEAINMLAQGIDIIMEKHFRSEHGHASYNICAKCDPE